MPRITPVHWKVLECIFKKDGFQFVRQSSSHLVYTKKSVLRPIIIPKYNEIDITITLNLMKTAKMSRLKYFSYLEICK